MLAACGAMFIAVAVIGCGSNSDGTAAQVASAIAITTTNDTTPVSGTIQFSATVTDAGGNAISSAPTTWTLVAGGGTITTAGLFTAGDSAGVFPNTIVATSGAVSSTSTVVVTAGGLASITITPAAMSVAIGDSQQYAAVGRDSHGNVVAISPAWSVVPAAGSVSANSGLYTAGTVAGTFGVRATSGSISDSTTVVVLPGALASLVVTPDSVTLPMGFAQQYTVSGRDAHNNVVVVPDPVWSIDGAGGTIDANGLFTAGTTAGTFGNSIHVMSGSICGSASVTINPGPLYSITVTGDPVAYRNSFAQFTAVGHDAGGNVVPITPVWSVVSTSLGAISSHGLLYTASDASLGNWSPAVFATEGSVVGSANLLLIPYPSGRFIER